MLEKATILTVFFAKNLSLSTFNCEGSLDDLMKRLSALEIHEKNRFSPLSSVAK